MNDGKIKLKLDKYDRGILINALNEFRNKLIREGKNPSHVDEIMLKLMGENEKSSPVPSFER